jgi:hypothetical protein
MKNSRQDSVATSTPFSQSFLRPGTAYEPSPRMRFDIVLNNLVAWAVTAGLIYLKSHGLPWRPIVHIEDISRAFLAGLHAPRLRSFLSRCSKGASSATFPQFHTSDDNLNFIEPEYLTVSCRVICVRLNIVGNDCQQRNAMPMCERHLSRRGLYSTLGGQGPGSNLALPWVLNLADGRNSLLDIAERADIRSPSLPTSHSYVRKRPFDRA